MGKEGIRRFKDTEEEDSSVVTRGRRQRGAEIELKRLMGGAPEVVSTIQANPNTDADVVSAEAIEPQKLSTEEAKKRAEKAIGETLGNDIWEELQKHEESKIPEEISQIYGDQTPPFGVLELYKKLNAEKRAEYITDLRVFEEKNKHQETSLTAPMVPATVEPLIKVETKKIQDEAVAHEEEEQAAIDARIAAAHGELASDVVPVGDLKKERVFDEKGAEYVDFKESVIDREGTPLEWRNKLRETVAWWASPSERLIRRNAELDADLDKIGGTEKYFRGLGEWYNKRKWYTKLAVGAGLGLGAAFSAGVSLPIALSCMSGIAAQRIAGLSTMYLKFEKKSHEEAWGKEKAFLKAAVYTAVMGLAIKEGIEYVSETESAHVVQKWLGEALGHFSLSGATHAPVHPAEVPKVPASAPEVATQSAVVASAPEVPQPAAAAAAGAEVVAPAVSSEIPGIEVTATPGHGYEYMMKRLWEQLQEKNIKLPPGANPESDLAQLLRADEKTIDGVVHRLAQDNEFFKGDGTSAHINLDSKLTIDTKGQIWLDHENILAPEDVSVTPAYHAEVPAPETGHGVDAPSEQAVPTPSGSELAVPMAEEQNYDQGNQVSVETHEASAPNEVSPANSESTVISNVHNVRIQTAEPHIYGDRLNDRFVYGGGEEQQMKMINEYLNKVKDTSTTTVYAEDINGHRVPWTLSEAGDLIKGPPVRYGFWQSFVESPNPQKFTKIIK